MKEIKYCIIFVAVIVTLLAIVLVLKNVMQDEGVFSTEFTNPESEMFMNKNVLSEKQAKAFIKLLDGENKEYAHGWDEAGYLTETKTSTDGVTEVRSYNRSWPEGFELKPLVPADITPRCSTAFTYTNGTRTYVYVTWQDRQQAEAVAELCKAKGYTLNAEENQPWRRVAYSYYAQCEDGSEVLVVYDENADTQENRSCIMFGTKNN